MGDSEQESDGSLPNILILGSSRTGRRQMLKEKKLSKEGMTGMGEERILPV